MVGRLLNLGTYDGCCLLTLTATWPDRDKQRREPDLQYLRTIAQGLSETYALTLDQILRHLLGIEGARGNIPRDELKDVLVQAGLK
jgi:hypothetical protein